MITIRRILNICILAVGLALGMTQTAHASVVPAASDAVSVVEIRDEAADTVVIIIIVVGPTGEIEEIWVITVQTVEAV